MTLTAVQVEKLLEPVKQHRVYQSQGHSHLPAFDVIAHLSRLFGFAGWDKEIVSLDLIHERHTDPNNDNPQGRWWVVYRCVLRLTIRDPQGQVVKVVEDAATGAAQNMPSPADAHDFAVKNAVSYAVKRCAKDLGDQFGLSLYNKGKVGGLVQRTLVAGQSLDDMVEVTPESMGNDELQGSD